MQHFKLKNFFVLLLSITVFFSVGSAMIAHADRDEDDEYEREVEEDDENKTEESQILQSVVQPEPAEEPQVAKVTKPKTVTKKITDPATTIIVNELRNIELIDGDRDGLVDSEDPHPEKPEIYLAKDDNQNGFVDTFEKYVAR